MSEKWTKLRTNRLQENVPLHLKAQKYARSHGYILPF